MNVLSISPIKIKKYKESCSTAEDLFFKCQPMISDFYAMQIVTKTCNVMTTISEQMANYIDKQHVIQGAEELIDLILLLSHNFYMFNDSLNNYLLSHFFQAIKVIRTVQEETQLL